MARSDIGVRVRAIGLDKSIVKQARAGERVVASKPIRLKLDAKGFAMPLGRITGQMSEFQKSLDASAARVFAFGAAVGVINSVGNAFKALIKDSIELNKSLTELNSIFRLTSKNLQEFGSDLFDVAKNTGQAFSEVTTAATEFSRQGLTATETLKRLNDAMILTRLSGLAATDSVKYLTAAINGFNKEALSSTEIVNRLANVDAGFAVSSRDLADAISRSGASAQAAKVEFNELLAIVTSVQQQTARGGAVIGNAFKTIFTRLQRSSVRGSLEEIGVATENANGSLRSATAILLDYAKAYQTLSDQQRAYTAEQVAGVRQVNNLKALITDMSGSYGIYNRALSTANNTTNQATMRNEEYNKTISAMAHQTALSVKEMSAAIGELTMGPGTERVLGMIQSIADFFNKVLDPQEGNRLAQGFMKGLGAYIAGPGLILIGGAFLKLFTIMGKLGADAVKSIFAVNTETQRRRALEEAILTLLIKEENAMAKLQTAGVSQAQKEKVVLDLLRQQTAERQRQASFLASLSGLPGLKGVAVSKQGHVVGKTAAAAKTLRPRAEGHVPNFSTIAKSLEVMQAVGLGASKNTQAIKGQDRTGGYYYNNEEVRVSSKQLGGMGLNSKGRDMILPTYGSAKQENLKKLGGKIGVSSSRAEEIFMGSAQGFVPNFRRAPVEKEMAFRSGKGVVTGKQRGAQKVGTYAPNIGAVVSQAPKGMGHSFTAKGRVGLSNKAMKGILGQQYAGNYYADFSFPVGGLRQADFRKELKNHFKFKEFVAALGFGAGNKPDMVHTNLESAMDKVGRNQGLGRIFEAAILQGLRMSDLPEEGTWDIPNWQNAKGKYTLGLPSKTKDVDVKYNIMDVKGNKTVSTMFQKAVTSRPYMKNMINASIQRKELHTTNKRRATGFIPNFLPATATAKAATSASAISKLSSDQLSRLLARSKTGERYPTIPKDFINPATGLKYKEAEISAGMWKAMEAKKKGAVLTKAKIDKSIALGQNKAAARRIIFGLTSPQTAGVIAPQPGLKGVMKGEHDIPGYGKVKMGYRMFGYNKAGPAAQQMGTIDKSVRGWSKNKASQLSNLMTPGKHLFEKFASEGGISGAVGSIFETAVQMALGMPAFKKETSTFDFPRGSEGTAQLKKGGLFPGVSGDWIDASVNPMDKPHMFKKIFQDIAVKGGFFKPTKGGGFAATKKIGKTMIPKGSSKANFVGKGKSFTLADGFVPNFSPKHMRYRSSKYRSKRSAGWGLGAGKSSQQAHKLSYGLIGNLEKIRNMEAQAGLSSNRSLWSAADKNKWKKALMKEVGHGAYYQAMQHGGKTAKWLSDESKTGFMADGFIPNFATWVWDSDVFQGGGSKPYPKALSKLMTSGNPLDVAMGPSGAGKTYWAAKKFGMDRFIKSDADLRMAARAGSGDRIMALSAMGQTKAGGLSAMSLKLLEASIKTGGVREYLYKPNMQLLANRQMRLSGGAHSLDPRPTKQLAAVGKRAPLNQFGFLSMLRKKYGVGLTKLNQGQVPNFAPSIYDDVEKSLKTEEGLTGRGAALGYDSRVGLGVYDPVTQSSLATAINRDHLGKGQSLGEALQASSVAQQTMGEAAGFIPNFAGRADSSLAYFARYSPDQQRAILDDMAKKGQKVSMGGLPSKAQVIEAAKNAGVGAPEIKSTKSAGLHGRSAAAAIAARNAATQNVVTASGIGRQTNVGPSSVETRNVQSSATAPSGTPRQKAHSVGGEVAGSREDFASARDEDKIRQDREEKQRRKEARASRMQMGLLGISMVAPVISEMLGENKDGSMGKGAMKGALQGAGIGAMVPMMMNNPVGWAVGGGIVAFTTLKGAMSGVEESSESLSRELDDENAKRQQNINAAASFVQAQQALNDAYKSGDVKLQIKNQEELVKAMNQMGDEKLRDGIIGAAGDLDKLKKVIEGLGESAQRRVQIANTLKGGMEFTDQRKTFAGRGSVGESVEQMREKYGEGIAGDVAEYTQRLWGNISNQEMFGGGGTGQSPFEAMFGDMEDNKGFLGTRLKNEELMDVGTGLAGGVMLSSEQVEEAYDLLGKNTVAASRKLLKDYFQLNTRETDIFMNKLDFASGEVGDSLMYAIDAEREMARETERLKASMLAGAGSIHRMDGEISRVADSLHRKMELVAEGFKKISKTLLTIRKSSVGGMQAMGVMTKREAQDDLMKFQEDIILQQAQLDTETVLRELLTETKDFNNKALKEAYQGNISTDFRDPLSFQGDKIISILNRDSALLKGTEAATLELVDKENEALHELQKINITSALSLIELRAQSFAQRKQQERKSFAGARQALSTDDTAGIRQGLGELFGPRGKATVVSEAETFTRLQEFFKIIEERFGVKADELQSPLFKDAMKTGGQFQELYNLLNFADELGGYDLLNADMKARMDEAPPRSMESRGDKQKWLMRNLLGVKKVGDLFPNVKMDAGQTVSDFYADPTKSGQVADIRQLILGGMFDEKTRKKWEGTPQLEGIIEMIGKSLLRMVSTARLEELSGPDRKRFKFDEEKGFLQKAIDGLIQDGKLDVKDIKNIFGPEVGPTGKITSTTERGLNLVRSLVKDLASIKTPEFKTLTQIQANTGETARLLSQYLNLQDRNNRVKELAANNAERDKRTGDLMQGLRTQDTELSDYTPGGLGSGRGKSFVAGLTPRGGAGSPLFNYARKVSSDVFPRTGDPIVPWDEIPLVSETESNVSGRGGSEAFSIPALVKAIQGETSYGVMQPGGPKTFESRIATMTQLKHGREAKNKFYAGSGRGELLKLAKEDILIMQLETLVNEAILRAQKGQPIAAGKTFLSAEWLEMAAKDEELKGGASPALSNVAAEGDPLVGGMLAVLNSIRKSENLGPGKWKELAKWLQSKKEPATPAEILRGTSLVVGDFKSDIATNLPVVGPSSSGSGIGSGDKAHLLGPRLRTKLDAEGDTSIADLEKELTTFADEIRVERDRLTQGVSVRDTKWTELDTPDFSTLDNDDLVNALGDWKLTLGMYNTALADLSTSAETKRQKESVSGVFDDKITKAARNALTIADRLEVAQGELGQVNRDLIASPDDAALLATKEERERQVEALTTRDEEATSLVETLISQRDSAIGQIDQEAAIIGVALEGAATKIQGVEGDADDIAKTMHQVRVIFDNMKAELEGLRKQGKVPARLKGEKTEVGWLKGMSDKFQELWSKPKATGFIPNFGMDPAVERAKKTEAKMGGAGSRPTVGWSDRVAQLRQGDGRMVFDPGKGQSNERVAIGAHTEGLRKAISNSASYQGARSSLPQFAVAYGALDYLPNLSLEAWNKLGVAEQQAISTELRTALGAGGAHAQMQKSAMTAHASTRRTHSAAKELGFPAGGLPSMEWYKKVYKRQLPHDSPLGSGDPKKLPKWYTNSDMGQFLEAMKDDDWESMAFFYDSIMSEKDRQLVKRSPIHSDSGLYKPGEAPPSAINAAMKLLSDQRQQPGGVMSRIRRLGDLKVRRPAPNAPSRHPGALGFIPNFVDPSVRVPKISKEKFKVLGDIALDMHGQPKGFHSTIERILADEDAVGEIAKRLGVSPSQVPDLIHKNIFRGRIPAQVAKGNLIPVGPLPLPDFPEPSKSTFLPPEYEYVEDGFGKKVKMKKADLTSTLGPPKYKMIDGKRVPIKPSPSPAGPKATNLTGAFPASPASPKVLKGNVAATLKHYISQELAGAALLEAAGIPHGGILGSTEHGVIKADLSKTHIDLEDWFSKNYQTQPFAIPPKPGASAAVNAAYNKKMAPKQVMQLVQSKFSNAVKDAGLIGSGKGSAGAFDMRPTNFMAPRDSVERIHALMAKGQSIDEVAEQIWLSRDVKFVDPGLVATESQIKAFKAGGASSITGDIPHTGPPRLPPPPRDDWHGHWSRDPKARNLVADASGQSSLARQAEELKAFNESQGAPKTSSRGSRIWKKLARLIPWLGAGLGAVGVKEYGERGDNLRATLSGIGTIPGAELADLAALGIDLGEAILWGKFGDGDLSPQQEAMSAYLVEKGILRKPKTNFFGKPEAGGRDFEHAQKEALVALQTLDLMEDLGMEYEMRDLPLDQAARDEQIVKDTDRINQLIRIKKMQDEMGKYEIPEGWDKHYAPWEAEEMDEYFRLQDMARIKKEAKWGRPQDRMLKPGDAKQEALRQEQIKKKNEETRNAWKNYWDHQREQGGYGPAGIPVLDTLEVTPSGVRTLPGTGSPGSPRRIGSSRGSINAGGFIPNFAPVDPVAKARAMKAEGAFPGTQPEFRTWPFPHVADAASQGVEGPSGWKKTMNDHSREGLSGAIANSARMQGARNETTVPNFAIPVASDDEMREKIARFSKTKERAVKSRGDLRSLPKFNEDIWRTFHLSTQGYPDTDIVVKDGEEWRGVKGPTTVYGKDTLRKRLQARLQDPIRTFEFDDSDTTIRAMYFSHQGDDSVVLNKGTYTNLSKGVRFGKDVSTLNNELTHFIQDNVLKSGGTMAPNSAKDVNLGMGKTYRQGYTDQELILMKDNIEALAWEYYSKHRQEKDGGLESFRDFADWETGVYGKKYGNWDAVYGGSKANQSTNTLALFKEIAAAHGDTWETNKITTNKGSSGKYLSLKDYHEANKNRPDWMDDLGDTGTGKLRDFTEIQSSYIGELSPLMQKRAKAETAQQQADQLQNINQGINVWQMAQSQTGLPSGTVTSLEGELDAWRKAKDNARVWAEPERAGGPVTQHGGGGTTLFPNRGLSTNKGLVGDIGGLSRNPAARFKQRKAVISASDYAGGFIPNFLQSFSGNMRGISDESFLPNFGILEDELSTIDSRLYPGKSVDWWRNLRSQGWSIGGGQVIPPVMAGADLGKWSHPLMGLSKVKERMLHAKQVDSSIRTLSKEYLDPITGEKPEELEARIAQFRGDTISETNPVKNFPRAKGLMYRAMGNVISGMPPDMRASVWARFKEREKLPFHILGVEDGLLQKTGANYDTRTNTMVLSKADVEQLRTSDVSPELREKFMKQFIVQMQDEVFREVGTTGSDYLRGEQTGSMKLKGTQFGEDPWATGEMEYSTKNTGFSPEEAEWGRRAADNLLWKMWDSASSTAGDDEEFIRRIDEVAEDEKNWANTRRSFGSGSLMDSRSTSTNAFGYTVSRWVKKGARQGHWQHDYKSEIEDKLSEVSRGHGGYSDWREHGRDPRKNLMFEVNDIVAENKFGALGRYIKKRRGKVGKNFPVTEEDMLKQQEYEALKQRGMNEAGMMGKLGQRLGLDPKFKMGIYSTAKVYGSLDEYRKAMKPIGQRVAEYGGADPLQWTGEKHSKHFEKNIRDSGYDVELAKEHKQLKSSTKSSRERVDGGGAPYSVEEFNDIVRFRELDQGLLAQRGKGEVVTNLAKQINDEKRWVKENKKRGFSGAFPQNDRQKDLLRRYNEARRGNTRINFRSGMGSVAAIGARVGRWDPWEEGETFDKRQKREKLEARMKKKFVNPDGSPNMGEPYQRRDNKGRKLKVQEGQQVTGGPAVGELISPLYGRTAFQAWQGDQYKISSRKEYEQSDVYKQLAAAKKARERQYRITSVADANEALRKSGYSEKELKSMGLGYSVISKKERRGLLTKRDKLEAEIETMKTLAPQNPNPPITQEQIAKKEESLTEMNLVLDKSKNLRTPEQLQRTETELNKDFSELYRLREGARGGGRLGRYHETEYDVVSGKIEGIKERRRDSQRVLTDKQIMGAAANADGMYDLLVREGVDEEDANAIVNGVPVGKVAQGEDAQRIKDVLMTYGPPRIRPKDYASTRRGPDSQFGILETSTEKTLRGKRKNLFMDATRLEAWLRDPRREGGGQFTEQEFLEAYSQMDMKTQRRTKKALRSLTSQTIGQGIMYGTGKEGAIQLGGLGDERGVRTGEYEKLLEVAELKDDSEKIKFIKNLIKNDGLGSYMSENPKSREEVTDVVDKYWDQFAEEVDEDGNGEPDNYRSLPGLQNKLVTDIIRSKVVDPTGLHWEDKSTKLIDQQARKDRKAKYVKDLARTRRLGPLLTGANGGQWRRWINEHPNKASFGDSPALNLLASGQADRVVSGTGGTALNVLSSLQDGSFMSKFMHLDTPQRSKMLDTLRDLKVHNGGNSLLDEHTRKRVKTQILKDQGITLDFTGQVALDRKDFDSTDDFFGAKRVRREEFLAEKEAKRQAALEARAERIKFGDPARRAREAANRKFRQERDAGINARIGRGQEALPELENLAGGFIPNFGTIRNRDGEIVPYWPLPGSTNEKKPFVPQYPGQIPSPSGISGELDPGPLTGEKEIGSIRTSRKRGEFLLQRHGGREKGDWDYRGYMKYGDRAAIPGSPAVPGSKVLPSLIKGRPEIKGRAAKKGAEYFSISQQHGTVGQWFKGVKGRKLNLGGQEVTVIGNEGELIKAKTSSGQIIDIPMRSAKAMEKSSRQRAKIEIQRKRDEAHQKVMDSISQQIRDQENRSGRKNLEAGLPIEFAQGFVPNFSPKGQSAIVGEIMANRNVGQRGVRPADVDFVKLNAGRGRSSVKGTMVGKGRHAESLVKTDIGDFVVPAAGQRGQYANRLSKQADAAGLHGLPEAVMSQTAAQGFIPNLQEGSVGISNVEEMRGLVERFEGTAQQIATTITEGSMEISHALNIEGKVAGLDQGQLINALQGAMSETASIEAGRQVKGAFNDNSLNSEVAPPPTDVPRLDRPGNS